MNELTKHVKTVLQLSASFVGLGVESSTVVSQILVQAGIREASSEISFQI